MKSFDAGQDYSQGFKMNLQRLAALKRGAQILAPACSTELHQGNLTGALKNLKALHHLSGVLRNEPLLISQLVRYAIFSMAISMTWESLQESGWTDSQL